MFPSHISIFLFILFHAVWHGHAAIVEFSCDCGVRWESIGAPDSTTTHAVNLNTRLQLIQFTGSVYSYPINSVSQAQWNCYARMDCRGFLTYIRPNGLLYAYLFGYTITPATPLSSTTGLDVYLPSSSVYLLTRNELYRCPSMALDLWYYYFHDSEIRTYIESTHCPYRLVGGACCWHPADVISNTTCSNPNPSSSDPTLNAPSASNWKTQATAHWNAVGFSVKLPPNMNCQLTPTLWDGSVNCAAPTSGCFESDGVPCGNGHGYCVPNTTPTLYITPNYCECLNYGQLGILVTPDEFDINGNPIYSGIEKYMGNACQYPTRSFCSNPQTTSLICNGFNTRCLPEVFGGTSGLTIDYIPACDCDGSSGTGTYCEINRCDTTYQCNALGGLGGSCQFNSFSSAWECSCGAIAVGSLCQYSAATCKENPAGNIKCAGRGVCMPPNLPFQSYPVASNPNFSNTTAWCQCTGEYSKGIYCSQFTCDTTQITEGRGQCNTATGLFLSCYPPFTSSNTPGSLKCDVDRCALTGGTATGSPPSTCNCGNRHFGPDIGFGGDISCYPRCPSKDGVVCGPTTDNEINTCVWSGQNSNTHYATCSCGRGYIPVAAPASGNDFSTFNPPPGSTNIVCEPFCYHGMVVDAWTPTNLLPCACDGTGFNTATVNGIPHPRCDNPVCQNGGIYQPGGHCECIGPYTSASRCATQTCDVPLTLFVEGVPGTTLASPTVPVCICAPPFAQQTVNDCSGSLCGPYGAPNPSITASTPPADMCICSPVQQTVCLDPTGATCNFCAESRCRNGGVIVIVGGAPQCSCPFPYTGGHLLCASDVCGAHGTPATGQCICDSGWAGATCNTLLPSSSTGGFINPDPSASSTAAGSSTALVVVSSSTASNHTTSFAASYHHGSFDHRILTFFAAFCFMWANVAF